MNIRSNCNINFIIFFIVSAFLSVSLDAQESKTESKPISKEDRFAKLEPKMIFPMIKGSKMTGVVPVDFITNAPDMEEEMKLVFDFTQSTANNAQGSHVNEGLEEVIRILNLHLASGFKRENLKAVVVFHSASILSIMNDEYYRKTYKTNNPNVDLLNQLLKNNIEMVVCGQSILLRELSADNFLPNIQFALSAKTTLSKYQNKGYILFEINEK
ncbi:MAG: DsrE family protein [Saprospiraceae bacterium]|nr:DsrE family protein [Saprospiraceae bacterium]MBP6523168.1 DsrE family protein [Saprospiraceae bacterium]